MGDDLTSARHFCDTVRGDITLLMNGICAQPPASPDILLKPLDRIQSGAKLMHARGIFRAAQTVVNSLMDRAPLPTVQGRTLSLNKLITQYETGLDDIAPRPANLLSDIEPHDEHDAPAMAYSAALPPMPDIDARFRAARAALAPLMAHAPQGQDRDALLKLANFTESELSVFKPAAAQKSAAQKPSLKKTPALARPDSLLDFERLMPDFVSQALQEARQIDKMVSVSYAADGVNLPQSQFEDLQNVLKHVAQTLVRSVLARPETRRERGLSGAGHIALTALQTPESLTISIECPGAPLAMEAYASSVKDCKIKGFSVAPGAKAHEELTHIILIAPRRAQTHLAETQTLSNSTEMAS